MDVISGILQSPIFWQPLLGVSAATIAFLQWQNSRADLQWKLYEKRLAVYMSIRQSMVSIIQNGNIDSRDLECPVLIW
jgi:hypothetical protein